MKALRKFLRPLRGVFVANLRIVELVRLTDNLERPVIGYVKHRHIEATVAALSIRRDLNAHGNVPGFLPARRTEDRLLRQEISEPTVESHRAAHRRVDI